MRKYYTCSTCGKVYADAYGAVETTVEECYIPALGGEHTWVDASCTAPKTCSVCNVTEGATLPHTYSSVGVCTVCGDDSFVITVDEAIEIGMKGRQYTVAGKNAPEEYWSADWYYVTVKANGDANASGFFRAYAADGTTQIAIAALTLSDGQTLPKAGDTIIVRAKIGRIATGEVRLYGATIVG